MSDQTMADDINTAINSGGYVIVPEKAVDGTGKDAIYVYMTYNSNGNQAWKISGGLNGGILILLVSIIVSISFFAAAQPDDESDSWWQSEDLKKLLEFIFSDVLPKVYKIAKKWLKRWKTILDVFSRAQRYIKAGCSDKVAWGAALAVLLFNISWSFLAGYVITLVSGVYILGPVVALFGLFVLPDIIAWLNNRLDYGIEGLCSTRRFQWLNNFNYIVRI